jgi:hypothetical protein
VLVELDIAKAKVVLGAMAEVATVEGSRELTAADRAAIEGAGRHVLGASEGAVDLGRLRDVSPADLATKLGGDVDLAHLVGGLLAVMPFVDGTVDEERIAVVLAYTEALRIGEPYVRELAELMAGDIAWVVADMSRRNLESVTGHPWTGDLDVDAWFRPWADGREDPELSARYEALCDLPRGTFGRAFADFYAANGFSFPGRADALSEAFGTPHDSTHVLSGYDTTPQGELLVSTFTATMHAEEPISGHVLPVILSWHVGIRFNDVAGAATGALDPEKLWVAWRRGAETTIDTFGPQWDFWSQVERPLAEVRAEAHVPTLQARYAAEWRTPGTWTPVA